MDQCKHKYGVVSDGVNESIATDDQLSDGGTVQLWDEAAALSERLQ